MQYWRSENGIHPVSMIVTLMGKHYQIQTADVTVTCGGFPTPVLWGPLRRTPNFNDCYDMNKKVREMEYKLKYITLVLLGIENNEKSPNMKC